MAEEEKEDQKDQEKSDSSEKPAEEVDAPEEKTQESPEKKPSEKSDSKKDDAKTEKKAPPAEAAKGGESDPPKKRKKKRRKKKRKKKKSVFLTFKEQVQEIMVALKEMGRSLVSADWPTRRMAVLFFLCILSAMGTFGFAIVYMKQQLQTQHLRPDHQGELEDQVRLAQLKQKEKENEGRGSTFSIGKYTFPISRDSKNALPIGTLSVAEVEIVVQCESPSTCKFIENNLDRVRDQLSEVFVEMDRDVLVSFEGKKTLKAKVRTKLNSWLRSGEIKEIFFVKLIVG